MNDLIKTVFVEQPLALFGSANNIAIIARARPSLVWQETEMFYTEQFNVIISILVLN